MRGGKFVNETKEICCPWQTRAEPILRNLRAAENVGAPTFQVTREDNYFFKYWNDPIFVSSGHATLTKKTLEMFSTGIRLFSRFGSETQL
jgi:hypothetical protein